MRLMCSCPLSLGIGKHLLGTGLMEHISRLRICRWRENQLHTQQAKALMLVPLIEILPISMIGQFRNAFLAYCLRYSCKRVQKYKIYLDLRAVR